MSSLRLTTSLQQRMVLTPQLRQRIEMLQMTSMELNDLIEQEMVANPVLEEVMPGEEVQEISESILDQNADGAAPDFENGSATSAETYQTGETDGFESFTPEQPSLNGNEPVLADSEGADDSLPD